MNAPNRSSSSVGPDAPQAAAAAKFVHLKVHSAYSLLEGALTIPMLAKLAVAQGFPALGLSDSNNLSGALEFSDKLAAAGIQPIIGVTLNVDFEEMEAETIERSGTQVAVNGDGLVALFAMSDAGYANLLKLVSGAHLASADVAQPYIAVSVLATHAEGLIALTGGPDGPVDQALRAAQSDLAIARLARLQSIFDDRLYVEIQRHGLKIEHEVEPQLLQLAYAHKVPIVATNEVYFNSPDDYEAHDALLCIAEGRYVVEDDRRRVTPEHAFKSSEQIADVFLIYPKRLRTLLR